MAARELGYAANRGAVSGARSGDDRYAAFGTAPGAAWPSARTAGAPRWSSAPARRIPRCPHDQIASLTAPGGGLSMTGAVVNGPNTAAPRIS